MIRARVLLIALAVLAGVGTYALVIAISHHGQSTPRLAAERNGVLEPVRADFEMVPGQPPPPVYEQPTCWNLKTPDLQVGDAGDMQLDINTCPAGDLPNDVAVDIQSESSGVAVAGPVHTERSRAAQSWTWRVTANAAGEHKVSIFVNSVDLVGLNGQIPATIVARPAEGRGGLLKTFSTGSATLNSIAVGLGSVVTSIGTVVTLRRGRAKKA